VSYGKGKIGSFSDAPSLGSAHPSRWVDQPAVVDQARRYVKRNSIDAADCLELWKALGIGPTPEEIAGWRAAVGVGPTETPSRNDEETTER